MGGLAPAPHARAPPAPFTVTGRDGDGAGDLSEPPRALAPVPALPRRSPSPSEHRIRPPSLGWARTRTPSRTPLPCRSTYSCQTSSTIHSTASTCPCPARTHHGSQPLRPRLPALATVTAAQCPAVPRAHGAHRGAAGSGRRGSLRKHALKERLPGAVAEAPAPSRPRRVSPPPVPAAHPRALAPGSEPPRPPRCRSCPAPLRPRSACVPACLRAGASRTSAPSGPRTQNSTSTSGRAAAEGGASFWDRKRLLHDSGWGLPAPAPPAAPAPSRAAPERPGT